MRLYIKTHTTSGYKNIHKKIKDIWTIFSKNTEAIGLCHSIITHSGT